MLWRILQAHGGKLPEDVVVCFANTGKEMPETLDFVQECSTRWNVPIVWLEYQHEAPRYRVVTYETASRNGEPFEELIKRKNYLPNPVARMCTVELKILTIERYLKDEFQFTEWDAVIGMRADEQRRVAKVRGNPSGGRKGMNRVVPLADAKVAVAEVGKFWSEQDFDLRLPNMNGKTMHGNCDLCFLKGANQLVSLIRERPKRAEWWMKMEGSISNARIKNGGLFRKDRPSYADMHRMALAQMEMIGFDDEALQDCACTD